MTPSTTSDAQNYDPFAAFTDVVAVSYTHLTLPTN